MPLKVSTYRQSLLLLPARHCLGGAPVNRSGYTLIEVLIAMAIFTSMVMLSMTALNQGLKQYKDLMDEGINFWKYAGKFWIEKSFNGIVDYYVSVDKKWFPYFILDRDKISYVTAMPLASEIPVVAWIVTEKTFGSYTSSLVYYELPVYTKDYDELRWIFRTKEFKQGRRVVLEEDVSGVTFECQIMDINSLRNDWRFRYDAQDGKVLPELVRIKFRQNKNKKTLVFKVYTNSRYKYDKHIIDE